MIATGYKNWQEFLQSHPDRTAYDEQAESIQLLVDPAETPSDNYRLLSENKPLVCVTKGAFRKNIQTTFFHTMKKSSILRADNEYFALNGFGERSYAVRVDPKEIFKISKKKGKVPSFQELIQCTSIEKAMELTPNTTMLDEKFENFTLLPPILTETLFQQENLQANVILVTFVKKIRSIKKIDLVEETEVHWEDPSNLDPNQTENNPVQTSLEDDTFDDKEHTFEQKFGKILKFIWAIIHQDKLTSEVPLHPCSLPSTMAWLDKVHEDNLIQKRDNRNNSYPPMPPPPVTDFQNVATSISRLSNTLENHHEHELKIKKEKDRKKDEKNFDNLSEVQKNIITLITTQENQTDDDIADLQPTTTMKALLEQSSSIKVQAQLQYEFASRRKFVCTLSSAMCASIKQEALASQPSHIEINGLSPFCTPNENKDDKLDQSTLLYMSEQMALGKVSADDVKQITKLSITFPKDFNAYKHYIKNFHLLLTLLSGPDSILSQSIKTMVDHAEDNERTYMVHGEDEWCFFASVLDHIHRRSQQFIHSAGEGHISKLKTRQLDFSNLIDEIEDFSYTYRTPKWLKTKKRSFDENNNTLNNGGGSTKRPSNTHASTNNDQKKRESKRGEKVINSHVNECLKVPQDLKYGDVFHPEMRKGITTINHNDGTEKCNNWHHRGFCYSKCKWKQSHNKTLSPDEIEKCKKFVKHLIEKFQNKQNGKVEG